MEGLSPWSGVDEGDKVKIKCTRAAQMSHDRGTTGRHPTTHGATKPTTDLKAEERAVCRRVARYWSGDASLAQQHLSRESRALIQSHCRRYVVRRRHFTARKTTQDSLFTVFGPRRLEPWLRRNASKLRKTSPEGLLAYPTFDHG